MAKALVSRAEPDPSDAGEGARPPAGASPRSRRAGIARRLRRLGTGPLSGAAAVVLAGGSAIGFPEGSIPPERGLRRLRRSAARGALETRCPITPLPISCELPALGKRMPWYAGPKRRLGSCRSVGEPIRAKERLRREVSSVIAARGLTAALGDYFVARVGRGYA